MAMFTTVVCDRCGRSTRNHAPESWEYVRLTATNANGRGHLPGAKKEADICEQCIDSLQAWFANPQQFRQLHNVAEAVLLLDKRPWSAGELPVLAARWNEATNDAPLGLEALPPLARRALAIEEESEP